MSNLTLALIWSATVICVPIAAYFGVILGERWMDRRDRQRQL